METNPYEAPIIRAELADSPRVPAKLTFRRALAQLLVMLMIGAGLWLLGAFFGITHFAPQLVIGLLLFGGPTVAIVSLLVQIIRLLW